MPIIGENKRNPRNRFDCPSCSAPLVYRHTLDWLAPFMWGAFIPLLIWFGQLPEESWLRPFALAIAILNVPIMFSLERLELDGAEQQDG
jgi:hypothetical protein